MKTWRSFNVGFVLLLPAGLSLFLLALVLIDPYGTGRLTPIQRTDIATNDNNYANATRLRDPRFNAAIIGNSRSMRLAPYRLNELTGLSFAMLAMPGLDPQTQITVASAFVRNNPNHDLTIVWGLGDEWCRTHYHEPIPFPRWLYEPSTFQYLRHLLASSSIEAAIRRAQVMLGIGKHKGTVDGYESDHPFWARTTDPAALLASVPSSDGEPVEADLPFVGQLAEFAQTLNSRIRLVFVFQPIYEKYMPVHGSPADKRLNRCKSELGRIGAATFIDMQMHTQLGSRPESFIDAGHFKDDIAIEVERASARALSK
jgi:hypothetical protein